MPTQIQGIEFEVVGSGAEEAAKSLDDLAASLKKIKSAASSGLGTSKASKEISALQIMLNDAKKALTSVGKGALQAGKNILAMPFKSVADRVKSLNGRFSTLLSSLKRIAFYRIIRTIIKEIGQAFKDGMNNLYGWSALVNGKFKSSMDMMATSMLYFKNSIGAAVAPIVNALAPAIDFIVDKIVALINLINQLFALLSGATFWTRAKKKAVEYGDAVGGAGAAAKEALRYLAPFDELNRLPDENGGGGGGGGGADYSDMFEEMQTFDERIEEFAKSLKDAFNRADWKELGTLLGNKVNELVNAVPWSTAGKKVGSFINAWFTTKYWTLNTVNFNNIGSKISTFLNNMLGEIDFETMGRTITQPFTNLGDLIIGAIETIDWRLVGSSISDFVKGAFKQLGDFLDKYDWTEVGSKMFEGLNEFIAGLDPMEVLSSLVTFAGKVASAMYQIIQGFFLGDKTFIDDSGVEWKFDVNGRLVKIEDKVPANQKVINNTTANLTTAKDSLTSRPSIKSTSSLTSYKNSLSSNPTLNSTASINKVDTTFIDSINPPSVWATADIYDANVADGITVDAAAEFTKIYGVPDYITTYGQIIYDEEGYYRPTEVSYTQMERNKSAIESQWGAYEYANGGVLTKGGFWKSIPQFASGGAIHGSLFLAGEDGTELVGRVGGRTEVLNRSQLAATMYASVNNAMRGMNQGADVSEDALYRAFRRALDETDFGGDVELDGEVMYRSMVRRNNQNTRMTGVNAFA